MKVFTKKLGSTALGTTKSKRRKRRSAPKAAAAPKRRRKRAAPKRRKRRIAAAPRDKHGHFIPRHPIRGNPIHLPRTARGRPAAVRYWILDVFKASRVVSYIGKANKRDAERDAQRMLLKSGAEKVTLAGPYVSRPSLHAKRK
jgi:hypothetical protein